MRTLFSVVIPLFNKGNFISDCIKSAVAQEFDDYEIIVVDDGSTDGGAEVAKRFSSRLVRLITQKNAGVAAARNTGIAHASFDWIAFLDADDLWAPWHLSTLREAVRAAPEVVGVAAISAPVPLGFALSEVPSHGDGAAAQVEVINYFKRAARDVTVFHTSSAAVRRGRLEDIGGFRNHKVGQDQECWVRVFLNNSCGVVARKTAFYRQDTGGAMDKLRARADTHPRDATMATISPAVSTLDGLLREGLVSDADVGGVCLYIDSRIAKCAVRLAQERQIEMVKQVLALIGKYRINRFYLLKIMASIPGNISVVFLCAFVRRVRWIRSKVRR